MDFSFADERSKEEQKDDGLLSPDEDITKGLSDADCRKHLNSLGRALSHSYIANAVISEQLSEGDEISAIAILTFKSRVRQVSAILDPMLSDTSSIRKLIPIFRL